MPVQYINFANLNREGMPVADFSNFGEGLKIGALPKQIKQQQEQQRLANALAQVQLQYAPQMTEAELSHKLAQANLTGEQAKYYGKDILSQIGLRGSQAAQNYAQIPLMDIERRQKELYLQNPLLQQTGTAGQIGALQYMNQNPQLFGNLNPQGDVGMDSMGTAGAPTGQIPNTGSMADLMQQSILADLRGNIARTNLTEKQGQGYAYAKTPMDTKRMMLAQAAGMGVDPNEASQFFTEGGTVADLARMQGLDPNKLPEPIYPSTQADLSRIKLRQQTLAELNYLQPIITEAMAPYARRFNGYSPKQIAQAIKGDDVEEQAKFLAAKGLQPEISSLRLKAMGGQVGIEAIREVNEASMGHIKSFQGLVSPEAYKRANEYVEQWITDAAGKANSIGLNPQAMLQQNEARGLGGQPMPQGGMQGASVSANPMANAISQAMSARQNGNANQKTVGGKTYVKVNGKWMEQ